jgi:hypothetical protein
MIAGHRKKKSAAKSECYTEAATDSGFGAVSWLKRLSSDGLTKRLGGIEASTRGQKKLGSGFVTETGHR